MARKTLTEKILIVLDGLIKESAAGLTYPHIGLGKYFRKYHGSLSQAIYDLKRRGYIEEVEDKGEKYLKLTNKGKLKIILSEGNNFCSHANSIKIGSIVIKVGFRVCFI